MNRGKDIDKVIEHYKKITKRSRIPINAPCNRNGIHARMREGATVEECIKVIDYKYEEWWNNERMRNAVNLVTLFRPSHFELYLIEANENLDKIRERRYVEYRQEMDRTNEALPKSERRRALSFEEWKEWQKKSQE